MNKHRLLLLLLGLLLIAPTLAACGGGGLAQTGTPATDPSFPHLMDGKWWADPTNRVPRDLMTQLQAESRAIKADQFELAGVFFTNCASDPTELAIRFANYNGIGSSTTNNGITLVVLLDRPGKDGNTPTIAIAVGDGMKNLLTKEVLDRILEKDFYPARSDGDWQKGLVKTVQTLHRVVKDPSAEELKTPPKPWWFWPMIIGIILIIAALNAAGGGGRTNYRGGTTHHSPSGGGGHSSSGTSG